MTFKNQQNEENWALESKGIENIIMRGHHCMAQESQCQRIK